MPLDLLDERFCPSSGHRSTRREGEWEIGEERVGG